VLLKAEGYTNAFFFEPSLDGDISAVQKCEKATGSGHAA